MVCQYKNGLLVCIVNVAVNYQYICDKYVLLVPFCCSDCKYGSSVCDCIIKNTLYHKVFMVSCL